VERGACPTGERARARLQAALRWGRSGYLSARRAGSPGSGQKLLPDEAWTTQPDEGRMGQTLRAAPETADEVAFLRGCGRCR
jgi:hypothetical protein